MANQNTQGQRSATRTGFHIPDYKNPLQGTTGYVEGFIRNISIRQVNTDRGETKVADVSMNVIMSDSNIKRLFGNQMESSNGTVVFRITYWGMSAEALEKSLNSDKHFPQHFQKGIAMIHNMNVDEYTAKTGKTFRTVNATGDDFFHTNSALKPDGETALDYTKNHPYNGNLAGTEEESAQIQNNGVSASKPDTPAPAHLPFIEGVFTSEDFADDDELPF